MNDSALLPFNTPEYVDFAGLRFARPGLRFLAILELNTQPNFGSIGTVDLF